MTREEALMLSAYTGVLLVPDFEDVHRYCEELMGFPILTHEFAEERLQIEIREKLRPRVWALCQTAADNPSSGREQVEKVWPGCEKCRNQANWPSWIEKGFVYCPKCGAPLTSWAWEKQMERLEGLKDGL